MKKFNSLQLQLGIIVIVITTTILTIFGFLTINNISKNHKKHMKNYLNSEVERLAFAISTSVYNFDELNQEALCKSLLKDKNIYKIIINANKSEKIFFDKNKNITDVDKKYLIKLIKDIYYNNEKLGTLTVFANLSSIETYIQNMKIISFFQIFLLNFILIIIIYTILSKMFIEPIKYLQKCANNITNGDLDTDIKLNNNNELGALSKDLDKMRLNIKDKISILQNEIKLREKEVKNRLEVEKELIKAKQYIDDILNSMPSLLIGVDINMNIIKWNKKCELLTGINFKEANSKYIFDVIPYLYTEKDKIDAAIKNKEIKQFILNREDILYEDITIYPVNTKGMEGAVIIIDDITEKIRMQEELTHSRKLDAIGQLAGGVAHDFNNMLAGILGGAEILSLLLEDKDEYKKYIDIIFKSAQRASDLTEKLLAFARKGKIESAPVDVCKAIKDAISILEHTVNKKIKIKFIENASKKYLMGDYSQIQNAMINLGVNASHAMPKGGTLKYIVENVMLDKIYCESSTFDISPGEYLKIEVNDTGEGIPSENLQKIFEPFFTTKKQGDGTGLGLAAVYGTVVQHKGCIVVYSELGKGTSFHIYLPLSEQDFSNQQKIEKTDEKLSGTVLVIDDEEVIRSTAKAILNHLGFNVILAKNGLEGLEIFEKHKDKVDLVILDMIMPKMDGTECFYELNKIRSDIPILLSSGFSRDADITKLKEDGLKGFLRKPFTTAELASLLKEILLKN